MGEMPDRRPPDEHPAEAGGAGMDPEAGSRRPDAPANGADGADGADADATRRDEATDPVVSSGALTDPESEPELAAFLARAGSVLSTGPDELTSERHLASMKAEAAVTRRGFGLRFVSVAAAAAILAVATLAGLGALPAPAQDVLSDWAENVGITLPRPTLDPGTTPGTGQGKQRPPDSSVPGRPGGPDRSELPGLDEDGTLRTPGRSDGMTPPGQEQDREPGREGAPGRDHAPGQQGPPPGTDRDPGQPEAPPGRPESPGQGSGSPPDTPPGQDQRPPSGTSPGQGSGSPPEQPPATPPSPPPSQGQPPSESPPGGGQGSSGGRGESSPPGGRSDARGGQPDDRGPASSQQDDDTSEAPSSGGSGNGGQSSGGQNGGAGNGPANNRP